VLTCRNPISPETFQVCKNNINWGQILQETANLATFVASNHLSESTPHLYISALASDSGWHLSLDLWREHFDLPFSIIEKNNALSILLTTINIHASVNCVAYSSDGSHIVSGSDNKLVQIWHPQKSLTCSAEQPSMFIIIPLLC
jgi:WD40 repeat protein